MTERDPAERLLSGRRTIHDFAPEPVDDAHLDWALEQAVLAPNHYLTQPWRFYRLGPDTVRRIAELNAEMVSQAKGESAGAAKLKRWLGIPGWLVVTCQRSENALRQREDYAACCCATHSLMLALWSRGIGSKWTTGAVTRDPRFYSVLDIDPESEDVVSLLWYGRPAKVPNPRRRPLDEFVLRRP